MCLPCQERSAFDVDATAELKNSGINLSKGVFLVFLLRIRKHKFISFQILLVVAC